MDPELLDLLRCPRTGQPLSVENPEYADGRIRTGTLVSADGNHRYAVREFIPRFVGGSNYADSFGMQWNRFRQTQLDSCSGQSISAARFWKATGWQPNDIAGKLVLDAGCGAGRFAEVALAAGARVVALDYSNAVDAAYANLRHYRTVHVVQGDIYALPFRKRSFHNVYSLGVLQHTPDVAAAFAALPPMMAAGGWLCVDFYEKSWKSALLPRTWMRPLLRRMPRDRLFEILERSVPPLLRISCAAARVPLVGGLLKRAVPVANHVGILPLSEKQHLEWALLDTFDWFSPEFDKPQTASTVRTWLERAGLEGIEVLKAGHLVGRGKMPDAARG